MSYNLYAIQPKNGAPYMDARNTAEVFATLDAYPTSIHPKKKQPQRPGVSEGELKKAGKIRERAMRTMGLSGRKEISYCPLCFEDHKKNDRLCDGLRPLDKE